MYQFAVVNGSITPIFGERAISFVIRTPTFLDVPGMAVCEEIAWGEQSVSSEIFHERVINAAEVSLVGLYGNQVFGMIVGTLLSIDLDSDPFPTHDQITAGESLMNHDPLGHSFFCANLCSANNKKVPFDIGTKLTEALYMLIRRLGVLRAWGVGIMPGFIHHPDLSVEEYCKLRDEHGQLVDPVMRFYEKVGLKQYRLVRDSYPDPGSKNWNMIWVWENPDRPYMLDGGVLTVDIPSQRDRRMLGTTWPDITRRIQRACHHHHTASQLVLRAPVGEVLPRHIRNQALLYADIYRMKVEILDQG